MHNLCKVLQASSRQIFSGFLTVMTNNYGPFSKLSSSVSHSSSLSATAGGR
jgi:hypothetical protein